MRAADDRHVDPDQTQWVLEVVLQATEGPAASAGIEFVRRPRRDGRCTGTVFAELTSDHSSARSALFEYSAAPSRPRSVGRGQGLGRPRPEDFGEDLVELVGQPTAPRSAAQRRGHDRHAHEHVNGDGGQGGHYQRAKHGAECFNHGLIVNRAAVKWNPETTGQRPQIPRGSP